MLGEMNKKFNYLHSDYIHYNIKLDDTIIFYYKKFKKIYISINPKFKHELI